MGLIARKENLKFSIRTLTSILGNVSKMKFHYREKGKNLLTKKQTKVEIKIVEMYNIELKIQTDISN